MAKKKEFIQDYVYDFLKGYTDKEGTLHTTFELEEMGGAEEEAISKADVKRNGAKIVNTLLAMCCKRIGTLEREDFNKSEWLDIIRSLDVGDQDIMLLRLREISKGTEVEADFECPYCGQKLKNIMETSEFEIQQYNGVDKIEFELPRGFVDREGNTHTKGIIRRPNGLDREILDPIARKNIGRANTLMLTRCIESVEGMKNILDKDVRDLKTRDREYLYNVLKDNQFGIKTVTEVECTECGEEFEGTLNLVNFI